MIESTALDEERLAKRDELKRRIAERAVQKRQIAALKSHLATINARTDQAEIEYQSSCKPLQAELSELDDAQVANIMAGENDPAFDDRRLEITGEIERFAGLLETVAKSNGALADGIQEQMAELGSVVSKSVTLETNLVRLADPALHERNEVMQSRIAWADRRVQAANESLQNYEANLKAARRNQPRAVTGYSILVEGARRELNDSQQQAAETQAEQNELRKRMLDE